MFGINNLIDSLNNAINDGTLSREELARAFGSIESIENSSVSAVETVNDLPDAENNKGRFFYIKDENRYLFSDGDIWRLLPDSVSNMYAWGLNTSGRLGDDTTTSRSSPVSVVGGFTDWISASAGDTFSLGVRANGSLWAWGSNLNGRLGDNSTTSRLSPVSVVGGFSDWVSASAGGSHSLGVRANGSLWAWGNNANGRLGDNTTTIRSSPVLVVGEFTDWIEASAGGNHSLSIRNSE